MNVYLSPHLDDAAFSCGGSMALQRARGERVQVISVCTRLPGSADAPAPCFAELAGMTPHELVHTRREEDARAMALLGVEYLWADALDAIYRLAAVYDSPGALSRPPVEEDPLFEVVADLLASLPSDARIYAPLGVGAHVDHVIVHRAARRSGRDVVYYEDLPYAALAPGAVEARISELDAALDPVRVDISSTLDVKGRAVAEYASQVGGLACEFQAGLEAYARTLGSGRAAERFWKSNVG